MGGEFWPVLRQWLRGKPCPGTHHPSLSPLGFRRRTASSAMRVNFYTRHNLALAPRADTPGGISRWNAVASLGSLHVLMPPLFVRTIFVTTWAAPQPTAPAPRWIVFEISSQVVTLWGLGFYPLLKTREDC